MANKNDNLIPQAHVLTLEEQKMGGKKSGKVRREKATMKATLEKLLDEKSKKGQTYRELATLGLIKGAVQGKVDNYKLILEMIGELGTFNNSEINDNINNIAELINNPAPNRSDDSVQ